MATAMEQADLTSRHIGYWDRETQTWKPWCEVPENSIPECKLIPTDQMCPVCLALAVGQLPEDEGPSS